MKKDNYNNHNQPDNQTTNNPHNETRTNPQPTTTDLINNCSSLNANGQQIKWLIFESGETPYKIAKATGVPDGNLYLIKKGERLIDNLSLSVASKLTEYATELQGAGINEDD